MKIINLKEKIDANLVKKMKFGDEDANQDKLLLNDDCFCSIGGINEILLGNKNYVLGVKGSGKTAIFRMLKEKRLVLDIEDLKLYRLYFYDDTLLFEILQKFVNCYIVSEDVIPNSTKYQISWELYFLYNIIVDLRNNPSDLPIKADLKEFIHQFELAYNMNSTHHFIDIIKNLKTTIHIKYDQLTHVVTPGMTFEPIQKKEDEGKNEAAAFIEININKAKELISEALLDGKRYIGILIDRLDDFVTKNEYDVQRELISALVRVERSYSNFDNMHFVIFMRNDLFEKIDYTDIGYDKIINRKVELVWKQENIREFIGRRIRANYLKYLKINIYQLDDERRITKISIVSRALKYFGMRKEITKDKNTLDDFNRALIVSFFRKSTICFDAKGSYCTKQFAEYLATYFCLANGYSNPRIILIYLETVMEKLRAYIESNFVREFKLDSNGCYNMISNDMIYSSYSEFQDKMKDIFAKIDKRNEKFFELFNSKTVNKVKIKAEEIVEILGRKKRDQIMEFIVFLEYSMYLKSLSPKNCPVITRTYEIPLMFRKIQIKSINENENV